MGCPTYGRSVGCIGNSDQSIPVVVTSKAVDDFPETAGERLDRYHGIGHRHRSVHVYVLPHHVELHDQTPPIRLRHPDEQRSI